MDLSPGGCLGPSVDHHFTPDEIAVATTFTRLKYLIPLYDFRNCGFITPLWGSKRPRSAYESAFAPSATCPRPDRLRTESRVAATCPVVSGGGNRRNTSPDSPLLLKDSPLSSGMQGSSGIVAEPPPGKMATKLVADDSSGSKISQKNPRKVKMESRKVEREGTESSDVSLTLQGQCSVSDRSSVTDPLPNGGAYASPGSQPRVSRPPLLFDLNIVPPDWMGIQSPRPDEEDNGITMAEKAKAARQKRMVIRRDQMSKAKGGCGSNKVHSGWRR